MDQLLHMMNFQRVIVQLHWRIQTGVRIWIRIPIQWLHCPMQNMFILHELKLWSLLPISVQDRNLSPSPYPRVRLRQCKWAMREYNCVRVREISLRKCTVICNRLKRMVVYLTYDGGWKTGWLEMRREWSRAGSYTESTPWSSSLWRRCSDCRTDLRLNNKWLKY